MGKIFVDDTSLKAIATGFRSSRGTSDKLTLAKMAELAAVPLGVEEVISHVSIPEYVKETALEVARKVRTVQTDDSITFIAISDQHHTGEQVDNWQENINIGNLHAYMAAKILAYTLNLDFVCNLGDKTFGSANTTPQLLEAQITECNANADEVFRGIPMLETPGNHDTGQYRVASTGNLGDFTGKEKLFALFGSRCTDVVYGSTDYGYCYLDLAGKKCRIICLNTAEGETYFEGEYASYVASPAQRLWFAKALQDVGSKADAADWSIIVLSHYPLDYGDTYPLSNIVSAYVSGGSTTENSTAISFDGKNAAKFVAAFHGHTHCFKYAKLNYIANNVGTEYDAWRVATPNASFYRENQYVGKLYYGIDFGESVSYPKTAGTAKDTAFVVNVINPSEQVIHSICYGAGYDRVIGYAATVYYSITKNLTNAAISSDVTSVVEGEAFSATVTANEGYDLSSVTVTMDGKDVTASVYSDGTISIPSVTGNVVITAVAVKQVSYTNLVPMSIDSTGAVYNGRGYKDGSYLSSSGGETSGMSAFSITGFIPIRGMNHVIRIAGEGVSFGEYGCRLEFFDSNFAMVANGYHGYDQFNSTGSDGLYYHGWTVDEENTVVTLHTGNAMNGLAAASYMRISCRTGGKGENLIVTIDEPIE